MYEQIHHLSLLIVLAPLIAGLSVGLLCTTIDKRIAHSITILGVCISFIAACILAKLMLIDNAPAFNRTLYTWAISGSFQFNIGFLVDRLSTIMAVTVTFISLLVHIYSIGYMHGDPGYSRFFSFISLFTFAMLTLVMANNFLQLFFGWEGVGLVSYLLIGFWFKKASAAEGSFKAFLVNRVGDFGFLLGIAAIFNYFNSIDYASVFERAPLLLNTHISIFPGHEWSVISVACILLFVGAMGKSAQVPLHVWLPESMEGPTPISALIHAATMVTAGIYLVARLSPLFEYSETALSLILIVGATGALFTGILALVQNDIKRIVAYSTLSQLGYMVAALGASAFSASIFHLVTHACFKALLFLAAGSVILGMHHEQDIRNMGNLRKYMPITYITFLIGALSLSAIPPFAGFYSKDMIIEAVQHANIFGAHYAYVCVLLGAFVTAVYIFRGFFLVFHTKQRFSAKVALQVHESPAVVWIPLAILAVPSMILGAVMVVPLLAAPNNWLGKSLMVLPQHDVLAKLMAHYPGTVAFAVHGFIQPPCLFALTGIFMAWLCFVKKPAIPDILSNKLGWLHKILINKYGFDAFNDVVFVRGGKKVAQWLYRVSDVKVIDELMVNGSGRAIAWTSRLARRLQSGYLYHYAMVMVFSLILFLLWFILR